MPAPSLDVPRDVPPSVDVVVRYPPTSPVEVVVANRSAFFRRLSCRSRRTSTFSPSSRERFHPGLACAAAAEAGAADADAIVGGPRMKTLKLHSDGALVIWGDNLRLVASQMIVSLEVIGDSSLTAMVVSAGRVASRVRAALMVPRPISVSRETVPGFLL